MWTTAAPARAASIADSAISCGVTGTRSLARVVSPAPVTAHVMKTSVFTRPAIVSRASSRDLDDRRPRPLQRLAQRRCEPGGVIDPHAFAAERPSERREVGHAQVDADRLDLLRDHLGADLAVAVLFGTTTGSGMPSSAAVASSATVNSRPPSPASAITGRSGAASFAPIAAGRA